MSGEAVEAAGGPTLGGAELPMFPLGTVLLPTMPLRLVAFEPRYRRLVARCMEGDRLFGVVLIERGSEVGGGDVRTDVGCTAEILDARETPDGRWLLECRGRERIVVDRWLPDDPHPRAEVRTWPDPPPAPDAPDTHAVRSDLQRVASRLVSLLDLAADLSGTVSPRKPVLDEDPERASYQLGAASPLGPLDMWRVLAAPDTGSRLDLLGVLLAEAEELLRMRAGGG